MFVKPARGGSSIGISKVSTAAELPAALDEAHRHDPKALVEGQLVAGGRYDGLLGRLGARAPIPAVGFAVWVDRLAEIGSAP